MPVIVELLRSRRLPHVAALALMSFGFAGCSADMQTRLSQSQNSFSNPFSSEATGSVQPPAPIDRREAPQYNRPAGAYSSSALPPVVGAPQSYPSGGGSGGISSGGRGVSSYAPPAQPRLSIRIDLPAGRVGPGKIALLEAIAREGSISAAGRALGMSYRRAWELVDAMNQVFGAPVVSAVAGGAKGGGARLTALGEQVVRGYRAIEAAAAKAAAGTLKVLAGEA